jgi:hypothetical protein
MQQNLNNDLGGILTLTIDYKKTDYKFILKQYDI